MTNDPIASPSSTEGPVSVPPTLPVSFLSSNRSGYSAAWVLWWGGEDVRHDTTKIGVRCIHDYALRST